MHRSNSTQNALVDVTCTETSRTMKVALSDLKRFLIENDTYIETSKIEAPVAETSEGEGEGETDEGDIEE